MRKLSEEAEVAVKEVLPSARFMINLVIFEGGHVQLSTS